MKKYRYLAVFIVPLLSLWAVVSTGWICWAAVIFMFLIIPVVELILPQDDSNLSEEDKLIAESESFYELLLMSFVFIQPIIIFTFLANISDPNLTTLDFIGRIASVGMINGACAINVAHELGHRKEWYKKLVADILLLTSLENHFKPYHNFMHHKNVATPGDSATARKGELIYTFILREQISSYIGAWKVENDFARKGGYSKYSLKNYMVAASLAQIALVAAIYFAFGLIGLLAFVSAAIIGIILLASTSYIEHYGLLRTIKESGRYEKVNETHSWNSNHPFGRLLLFELSRHSDHHYKSYKPFQILDCLPDSPQLPTGYTGMILLSFIPPLFFKIMHSELNRFGLDSKTSDDHRVRSFVTQSV